MVTVAVISELMGLVWNILGGGDFTKLALTQARVLIWIFIASNKHAQTIFSDKVKRMYSDQLDHSLEYIKKLSEIIKNPDAKQKIKETTLEDRFKSELL